MPWNGRRGKGISLPKKLLKTFHRYVTLFQNQVRKKKTIQKLWNGDMHLHMWNKGDRQKGLGVQFVQQSIVFYFKKFQLQRLISEPYALNPAPTKTILANGFKFIKEYETTPGTICFLQNVKRYELKRETWEKM